MSIRWRLTLWFSSILLAILSLGGVVLNALLSHYLFEDIDGNLKVYTARVHGSLNFAQIHGPVDSAVIRSRILPLNEFSMPGIYIQLMDANGKVIVKSNSLGNQELPVNPRLVERGLSGMTDIETVAAGDGVNLRIMASPVFSAEQVFLLEVAQSLKPVESTLAQLRLALAGGIFLALLFSGVSGAILVRRVLAPVERITVTARSINDSSDLDRRVGYTGPGDEIGQLAETFDHMIDRLAKTFESQKHFVSDASHELRTPLTVMQGNLDLLKRNMGEDSRRESLRAIEAETGRMTSVVGDLLLLAEVEAEKAPPQDMVPLAEIVRAELRRARQMAGAREVTAGRVEDLAVRGDAHRLTQLLSNLVDNAVRYTPDGGRITVSLFREGNRACLEVSDTGIGIAPEHLPYIFDRFYRVDKARSRASGGTGLGLAIARGIAEQHGGSVSITSQPGKGSTFTVRLKL